MSGNWDDEIEAAMMRFILGELQLRFRILLAALLLVFACTVFWIAPTKASQAEFATQQDAVDALIGAVRTGNDKRVLTILGTASRSVVSSGDPVYDANIRKRLLSEYDEAHELTTNDSGGTVLVIGQEHWPFPYPLVKSGAHWRFDTKVGTQEILDRRIGENELDAIEVCHAYVAAQRDYATEDRNRDGYVEYAQKFLSSPGKQDGLYWPSPQGQEESPLGPLMASARAEGYRSSGAAPRRTPYHGYYYKILTAQGAAAKDGAYSYMVNGHMIGGFAMVAFPARYGASGIMTFIVNYDDVVYQKDLGPDTPAIASRMTAFDPDSSWKPAESGRDTRNPDATIPPASR